MRRPLAWLTAVVLAALSPLTVTRPAHAAAGCRVDYTVRGQWPTGFEAAVTITNLGPAISSWTLRFGFPDPAQKVAQGWDARWSQAGSAVTADNATWNGSVATDGSVGVGFTGAHNGTNPSPTTFSINGTTCSP